VQVTVSSSELDDCGRVVDFGQVKQLLGTWLDAAWDHGLILQEGDPLVSVLQGMDPQPKVSVLDCPPTAENLSAIVFQKATELLPGDLRVERVRIYETPNCWADYEAT
jgi:6-pyruvoyltetrahydropterin/6-carboxytetrahydropterin synthase